MEPLPPVKEVEYRCYIGKTFEELSGTEFITFGFETAKEFSSFRYEIAVRYRIQPNLLEFKVLGMTATRTMMPAFGTARSVLKLPLLPFGVYTVKMIKSDGTENIFSIEITKKGFQILAPVPRKRFIDLIVENKAAVPGAKNLSTISKTPPPPLIPRTIQKRQPPPPTPEEQAILDSLRSETIEEREAREERELFGDMPTPTKSSAKHAIDEVKEVPANVKPTAANHNGKAANHNGKVPHKPEAHKEAHKEDHKPHAHKPEPAKHDAHKSEPKKSAAKPASKPAKPAAKAHAPAKAKPAAKKAVAKKPVAKPKPKAKPAPKKPAAKKAAKKR